MDGMLKGYRALITGGTRGIGAAIAQRFMEEGAEVMITGTTDRGTSASGCDCRAVDFQDDQALQSFAGEVRTMGFDILVNNAGINKIGNFENLSYADFQSIQQVNVNAAFLLCRSVIQGMKQKKWGRIINISSIFGKVTKEMRAPYSASKFALDGMTAALAAEVAQFGILANCIAPGFIDTELTRRVLGEKGIEELVARVPIGRLGSVDEIAAFVSWLAGPENTYISGQNIAIDGGFTRV